LQYLLKTVISAVLIVAIAEVSKRIPWIGGLIASLPLTSLLAMVWLYKDTHNAPQVGALATSIFWMVLPSLALFVVLPFLIKKEVPFYWALLSASLVTCGVYYVANTLYAKLGIS